jgi:hypothetical protein
VLDNFQGLTEQNRLETASDVAIDNSFKDLSDPSVIIVGDERDVLFHKVDGSGLGRVVVHEDKMTDVYSLEFPNDAIGYSTIQYDGMDGSIALNPIGLGGVDFTEGGTQHLLNVAIPFSDHATQLLVTVYSDADSASEYAIPVEVVNMGEATLEATAFFTDFQKAAGATNPADFSNVGAMEIHVDGNVPSGGLDIQITSIGTASIPEPGSVISLLVGAMCLLGFRTYRLRRSR